jgi:hypothetical protein
MRRDVILVPRREDRGYRDIVWAWCKARWERDQPHMPIVEGHHDTGLFNRSAAVNRAAQLAGSWDVAVIIDADIIIDPVRVRDACDLAARTGKVVFPHDIRHQVNRRGSEMIRAGYLGDWKRYAHAHYDNMVSSVVVVPRKAWDEIGGFDESFEGWGFEDNAFAAAAETFAGTIRMEGEFWHFWHPTVSVGRPGTPVWQVNSAKGKRYIAATGDRAAIRALQAEPRGSYTGTTIPKILHRVVPEHSPPEAEQWWAEFGRLHPDWTLLTHRDPLREVEWPKTSRYWSGVRNGAQLADLVRLEALLHWGGVYVDQDMQPFRSLEPLLNVEAFAAWEDERCVPNAVLGARPDHPAIRKCLELCIRRQNKGTWAAGAGVTTEVLPGRADVLLLPPESFYPVSYQDPDRDRLMREFDPRRHPWTFALHHYWFSWADDASKRSVPAA